MKSIALAALTALSLTSGASALDYPTMPIRVVTGSPAGAYDAYARILIPKLQETLGQPLIVDNKVGVNGILSVQDVMRAQPDGHTLLFSATGTLSINPSIYPNIKLDPAVDLEAVAQIATVPMVWVTHHQSGFASLPELIATMKSKPEAVTAGLPALGSLNHLVIEAMRQRNNLKLHTVNYRSAVQAQPDMLAGRISFIVDALGASMPLIASNQIVPLAVTTAQRSARLPNVATVRESGLDDREYVGWYGFMAPKGTPRAVVERLNKAINNALADPDVIAKFRNLGAEPRAGTPEQFGAFIASERDKLGAIARGAGVKVE